jgi:hypothetical protein
MFLGRLYKILVVRWVLGFEVLKVCKVMGIEVEVVELKLLLELAERTREHCRFA